MKPYQIYSLIVAVTNFQSKVAPLVEIYKRKKSAKSALTGSHAERNLSTLAAVLEDPDAYPKYREFFEAGSEKTNVAKQRVTRFLWYSRALDDDLP
jgi:hypothetical protein